MQQIIYCKEGQGSVEDDCIARTGGRVESGDAKDTGKGFSFDVLGMGEEK